MHNLIEKEIKILDVNKKKLIKKLKKLGAEQVFKGKIHDIYYDTDDASLASEKKRIRLRKKKGSQLVTMKQNLKAKKIKACHETEFAVDCHETTHDFFLSQGLRPQWEKRKKRISYKYKGVIFDIDLYKGMPTLLEIEANNEKNIFKWIKKLGLQKKTTATFGARGLFKFYDIPVKRIIPKCELNAHK